MPRIPEQELLDRIDRSSMATDLRGYEELSALRMRPDECDQLEKLDPISDEYREMAFSLYKRLGQRSGYDPHEHEQSNFGEISDVWRGASPFSFGSSRFIAEFLI